MRLGFFEESLVLQLRDDQLARFETIFAAISFNPISAFAAVQKRSGVDACIGVEDADFIQTESFADVEVVEVMSRCDLQRTGGKLAVDERVGDQRHDSSSDRQTNLPTHQSLITLVIRMYGDGGITEHSFGTGSRDKECLRWIVSQRIADMPKIAVGLFVHHFDVGERGLAARAPVD